MYAVGTCSTYFEESLLLLSVLPVTISQVHEAGNATREVNKTVHDMT